MSISLNFNSAASTSQGMGLGAGIDVTSVVQQILDAGRAPEALWKSEQSMLNVQTSSWKSLQTNISTLQDKVRALSDVIVETSSRNRLKSCMAR